jgi:hypothetical protein
MSDHVNNFFGAVSVLAGNGHIKQRLTSAYEDNLETISDADLPVPVRHAFGELKHLMHRVTPTNGEGPICASVRKMSVEEAGQCAQLIVDLYRDMLRNIDGGQAALPLQVEDRQAVPPFLVKSN